MMEHCNSLKSLKLFSILILLCCLHHHGNSTDLSGQGNGDSLLVIHARGTHYQVGYQVGRAAIFFIHEFLSNDSYVSLSLIPYQKTKEGRKVYEGFLKTVTKTYPQYVKELHGIADGARVDFDKLFLLHISPELSILLGDLPPKGKDGGCSDMILNTQSTRTLVHSEDVPRSMLGLGYMVKAHIYGNGVLAEEEFTCYSYPGMLCGNTFGINKHGLIHSGNVIFQKDVQISGIPRRFVNRAVLAANSVEAAIKIARVNPGIASGFNMMLGDSSPTQRRDSYHGYSYNRYYHNYKPSCPGQSHSWYVVSTELAGSTNGTLNDTKQICGFDFHFNEYDRLDVASYRDPSTLHRKARLSDFITKIPKTNDDLKVLMSDTKDNDFPIFRDGREPDYWATMAIGLFDMVSKTLSVYHGPPNATEPVVTFKMGS